MSTGLSVAFFGSSLVSAYWNGAATYYRGLLSALSRRGHRVTFYEPDALERQSHRDLVTDPPYARVVVYPPDEAGVAHPLLEAREMDVVVKASGVGVLDELLEEAVLAGRRPGQAVVFWDVDAPATLARVRRDPSDAFLRLIAHYDLILTYGGGEPVSVAYRELGARQCVSIYNGVDPETHHPVPPDPRFEGLLAFLGNRLPDREARVHEFFFSVARALPNERFLLGGNGWDRNRPALPNVVALGHVYTADHNAFNVTPRAVLSVNRESMAHVGYSPATRIFEAAGAGACLITDAWDGLESFLEPGREWLVARSGDEVMAHLRDLTPARAQEIGRRARARVLAEHTYEARARQAESLLVGALERPGRDDLPFGG